MTSFQPTQMPNYDPEAVQPMRDELTVVGFKELLTPQDVDDALDREDDKTVLVVLNSVCGCAAGSARPGTMLSLQANIIPDELVTLFAGMEKDAVDHYRKKYLSNYPSSSPSITLFKNGKVVGILNRHNIEGRSVEEIVYDLDGMYSRECKNRGPSISAEEFENITKGKQICGSKIPKINN